MQRFKDVSTTRGPEGKTPGESVPHNAEAMEDRCRDGDRNQHNAGIVPVELERLKNRVKKAVECANFAEAYENMYDASEGAGLGIILTSCC